jgi:hypothetical protein
MGHEITLADFGRPTSSEERSIHHALSTRGRADRKIYIE